MLWPPLSLNTSTHKYSQELPLNCSFAAQARPSCHSSFLSGTTPSSTSAASSGKWQRLWLCHVSISGRSCLVLFSFKIHSLFISYLFLNRLEDNNIMSLMHDFGNIMMCGTKYILLLDFYTLNGNACHLHESCCPPQCF